MSKFEEVMLSQGYVALIDEEDVQRLGHHNWLAKVTSHGAVYAYRLDSEGKIVFLHRDILMVGPNDSIVDHANGDTLDNRRVNLRLATSAQNAYNRRPVANCSSRFKGVRWVAERDKWRAEIHPNGTYKHLGYFTCERAAANAYNCEALRQYGKFAWLNDVVNG